MKENISLGLKFLIGIGMIAIGAFVMLAYKLNQRVIRGKK